MAITTGLNQRNFTMTVAHENSCTATVNVPSPIVLSMVTYYDTKVKFEPQSYKEPQSKLI